MPHAHRPRQRKGTAISSTHSSNIIAASALSLWSMPALGQTRPERLSDKHVKKLIDQVGEGRDKFEGNLDSQFKGSTLRGPSGETKVAGALQDYLDTPRSSRIDSPATTPPALRSSPSSNSPLPSTRSCKARRAP